jgi:hypothetical protein
MGQTGRPRQHRRLPVRLNKSPHARLFVHRQKGLVIKYASIVQDMVASLMGRGIRCHRAAAL